MEPLTHAQYLTSHTAFLLAAVCRPAEAPALAAQCLLPVADVLPAARERRAQALPWLSVEALVKQVGQEEVAHTLIYEAWVADLVLALRRRMARWPRLWQDPVRAYLAAEYDVRLDDPRDLAALAREASAARREAIEALYGEEGAAYDGPAAWEVWAEDDEPEAPPEAAVVARSGERAQREENEAFWRVVFLADDEVEVSSPPVVFEDAAAEESWGYFLEEYEEYHLGSGEPPLSDAELHQAWQHHWDAEQRDRRRTQGDTR